MSTKFAAAPPLLVPAANFEPSEINWLWRGFIPAGKLSIIAGAPGVGKTTLGLNFMATISAGGQWPDGAAAEQGETAIWTGEDSIEDSLIPRLLAMDANLDRVKIVGGDVERPFDPARDVAALQDELNNMTEFLRLLVIDPLVAVLGSADSHRNSDTRAALGPLAQLAADTGAAVLGVHHLTKGSAGRDPLERLTGSLAFGALARSVLIAGESKSCGPVLMRAKSNLSCDRGGFAYQIIEQPIPSDPNIRATRINWGEPIEGRARDVLAATETENVDAGAASALSVAKRWLEDLLSDGPVAVREVESAARAAGMAWATIRRAKDAAGIEARKGAMDQGWTWAWPSG
jgi:putative DNA primase/helicase